MAEVFATDGDWKPVKIGAGGMVTGIDVHKDGTMVARTDGAGAYIWDGAKWVQMVTAYTMPADTLSVQGVYEIRIAPSDSNVFYMQTSGGVYKSIDQGASWTKTAFPTVFMDANGDRRADGQKMAVDPNNPDVVFAGTQKDGLWVTRDGGDSWQKVAAIPSGANSNDSGLAGIVIHNNIIYVGTDQTGVYRSTDGGLSWQSLPGGPVDVAHAVVSPSGVLYATDNNDLSLWKYSGGTWTKLLSDTAHAVAIDPFDPAHLIVVNWGGTLQQSDDGGATWSGSAWSSHLESSADIPWLENSGNYMSASAIMFDPITPNKLYQAAGVGVWNTILNEVLWIGPDGNFQDVIWNSQSVGIENVVPNDIIAPLGGNPVFASWDRAFFEMDDLDSYATNYSGGDFSMGWSLDYASTDPSFVVGISDYFGREHSGFSTDGGQTWQKFAGLPSFALNTIGGSIAASTPTNFIWAAAGGVAPAYTLDGGKTWTDITIPGLTDWSGFHHAYYLKRTTITADRVDDNTFYLYDVLSGVYVTKDGGVNWTKVFNGQISDWSYWSSKIEAVPGSEGELFFTTGMLQGSADISFMHSTDGGASWQAVAGVEEVTSFSFGAPKVAGGPATVFIIGFVNNEYGIWYSTDNAESWIQIGRYPMGNLDTITVISGDMDDYGMVYVGLGGNSYAYLSFDDTANPLPSPAPVPDATPVPEPLPPVTSIPDQQFLFGTNKSNVLVGVGSRDQIFGKGGEDTITGGGTLDYDTLSGGSGNDTFLDTKSGLNGDTITDFTIGDKIIFSDATLAGFTYSLAGNTLTYSGGSLTLTGVTGTLIATAAVGGGVQLALGTTSTTPGLEPLPPVESIPDGVVLSGNNRGNVLVGTGSHDQIFGRGGNDTITGGGILDYDTLTGGAGKDTFLDTKAGFNGDTITDFTAGDKIIFSDATLAGFSFSLAGGVLTYAGGSLTLTGVSGTLVATVAATGGVQLALKATSATSTTSDFNTISSSAESLVAVDSSISTYNAGSSLARTVELQLGDNDILWSEGSGQVLSWVEAMDGVFASNNGDAMDLASSTNWNVAGDVDDLGDWAVRVTGDFAASDNNVTSAFLSGWHVQTADVWI